MSYQNTVFRCEFIMFSRQTQLKNNLLQNGLKISGQRGGFRKSLDNHLIFRVQKEAESQ